MPQDEQSVSTEAQRLALEAMSADLVHKLNLMIQEQETRAREFAAAHHHAPVNLPPQSYTPQPAPSAASYAVNTAPQPARQAPQPPPLRTTPIWDEPPPPPRAAIPRRRAATKPAQEEDSGIGTGTVIFALVGIILLVRSCT